MDPGSLPPRSPTPTLDELHRQLLAAERAYPELLRPLRQARASVERRLGQQPATGQQQHNRGRVAYTQGSTEQEGETP